jgi:hypothetical protein
LGKNPYRHQKVLVSNLGLTVFVKHQVNWLNRFHSLPSGREKKKKTVKRQKPQVFSVLAPYQNKSLQMLSLSLFIKRMYASQNIEGDKGLLHQESPSMPLQGSSFWTCKPSWLL